MLGFLRRNLRISSHETKTLAYIALVHSNLEYCATVWNPYKKEHICKTANGTMPHCSVCYEQVQEYQLSADMPDQLQWKTLETRRTKLQLTMLYKIVNNFVDVDKDLYLTPATTRTRTKRSNKFRLFPTSRDCFKYTFFSRTIPLWNDLLASIAEAPDLVLFKQELFNLSF